MKPKHEESLTKANLHLLGENIELKKIIKELEAEIIRHHKDFAKWEDMADKGAAKLQENKDLKELLHSICHKLSWVSVTTQLTFPQRELFAKAIVESRGEKISDSWWWWNCPHYSNAREMFDCDKCPTP